MRRGNVALGLLVVIVAVGILYLPPDRTGSRHLGTLAALGAEIERTLVEAAEAARHIEFDDRRSALAEEVTALRNRWEDLRRAARVRLLEDGVSPEPFREKYADVRNQSGALKRALQSLQRLGNEADLALPAIDRHLRRARDAGIDVDTLTARRDTLIQNVTEIFERIEDPAGIPDVARVLVEELRAVGREAESS